MIRKILIVICAAVMLYSAWNLYTIYSEYEAGENAYEEVSEQYVQIKKTTPAAPEKPEMSGEEAAAEEGPLVVDFEAMRAENSDVIGWIWCEDTPINYPVLRAEDNDKYLRRLPNGKYNSSGSIFMDYRCSADLSDLHTIIYGHNMKNSAMFGTLPNFSKKDWRQSHGEIYLLTPDSQYLLKPAAGFVTDSWSEIYAFPDTAEDLTALIGYVLQQDVFDAEGLQSAEQLLTLSTCTYEYEDARYVLVCTVEKL